jgi:hypothetical protein
MPAKKHRALRIAAAVGGSFTALIGVIVVLMIRQVVSFQLALLMLVALLGLYFGFGVLIAVHRFVDKLD